MVYTAAIDNWRICYNSLILSGWATRGRPSHIFIEAVQTTVCQPFVSHHTSDCYYSPSSLFLCRLANQETPHSQLEYSTSQVGFLAFCIQYCQLPMLTSRQLLLPLGTYLRCPSLGVVDHPHLPVLCPHRL